MSRFGIEKYLSSRYFSSWLILTIDTVVSVVSTLIAYLLVRGLFTNPVFTVWYGFWLLAGSCVLSVFSFIVFRTFRSVIRHTTLREIWKLGGAVLFKDLLMFFYDQVEAVPPREQPSGSGLRHGGQVSVSGHASSKLAALPRRRFSDLREVPAQAYDRGVPGLLFRESAQRRIPAGPSRCRRDPFRHQ